MTEIEKRVEKIVACMWEVLACDLKSIRIVVYEAIKNPNEGIKVLLKHGIVFSKKEKETIRSLPQQESQFILLDKLEECFFMVKSNIK